MYENQGQKRSSGGGEPSRDSLLVSRVDTLYDRHRTIKEAVWGPVECTRMNVSNLLRAEITPCSERAACRMHDSQRLFGHKGPSRCDSSRPGPHDHCHNCLAIHLSFRDLMYMTDQRAPAPHAYDEARGLRMRFD
jgi:hypothetical protein